MCACPHTHKYSEINTCECPSGKTVHPNRRLNGKEKEKLRVFPHYVPFFLSLSVFHLQNPSLHLISIDLPSKEQSVRSECYTRATELQAAFSCLIQRDKYAFVLGMSQEDESLRASVHTHALTPTQQAATVSQGCHVCFSEQRPAWWRCPRSCATDVTQELSVVLKPAQAPACCVVAGSKLILG